VGGDNDRIGTMLHCFDT